MTILGNRIKEKRMELKWSQRDLAAKMGYSNHSTITRIESGKIDLPQSKIKQFADVLGVSPSYLMGWDKPPKDIGAFAAQVILDPSAYQIMRGVMELDATDKRTVAEMIEFLANKKSRCNSTD